MSEEEKIPSLEERKKIAKKTNNPNVIRRYEWDWLKGTSEIPCDFLNKQVKSQLDFVATLESQILELELKRSEIALAEGLELPSGIEGGEIESNKEFQELTVKIKTTTERRNEASSVIALALLKLKEKECRIK